MPRHADVEAQKAEIALAVWRLAERSGIEGITLREVAAEAGISMGRVQHYFSSKKEMLLFGLERAQVRLERRVEERLNKLPDAQPATILRELLDELLGAHSDTRQLLRVSVAFYTRALDDPAVAQLLTAGDEQILGLAADAIGTAARLRSDATVDPALEAEIALALAVSLGVDIVLERIPIERARHILGYHLDRVLRTDSLHA